MKKLLFLLLCTISLQNCTEKMIYMDNPKFGQIESNLPLNNEEAIEIYERNFKQKFGLERDTKFTHYYQMVVYIENNNYYIGYRSTSDKRDQKTAPLYYLAKINPYNREIEIIKK